MSTRRKIEKILKSKGIRAEIDYERGGPQDYGYWTVTIDLLLWEAIGSRLGECPYHGVIQFIHWEDGEEELNLLPALLKEQLHD